MSEPRRSLGPVIAYMLTLLGLVLGGIWLWDALHNAPPPHHMDEHTSQDEHVGQVAPPPAARTSPSGEELSATERKQLENILRRKPAAGKH